MISTNLRKDSPAFIERIPYHHIYQTGGFWRNAKVRRMSGLQMLVIDYEKGASFQHPTSDIQYLTSGTNYLNQPEQ